MTGKKAVAFASTFVFLLISFDAASGASPVSSEKEDQEFRQALAEVRAMEGSVSEQASRDLAAYEKFADGVQQQWRGRNKEHYARLMLAVCSPLSSGDFKDNRQYDLARKYALGSLADPDAIPLDVEMQLTGQLMTVTIGPRAVEGEDLAKSRRRDAEARLHVWKRLVDALDPNWDPKKIPESPNGVGADLALPMATPPESVADPVLRVKYEAALEKNRREIERHTQQVRLHDWLKTYPPRAEDYIVHLYSKPPFDTAELKQLLDRYSIDEKTKARMLDAVTKSIGGANNREPVEKPTP